MLFQQFTEHPVIDTRLNTRSTNTWQRNN